MTVKPLIPHGNLVVKKRMSEQETIQRKSRIHLTFPKVPMKFRELQTGHEHNFYTFDSTTHFPTVLDAMTPLRFSNAEVARRPLSTPISARCASTLRSARADCVGSRATGACSGSQKAWRYARDEKAIRGPGQ